MVPIRVEGLCIVYNSLLLHAGQVKPDFILQPLASALL